MICLLNSPFLKDRRSIIYVKTLSCFTNCEIAYVLDVSDDPMCWTTKYCKGTEKNRTANWMCSRCSGMVPLLMPVFFD